MALSLLKGNGNSVAGSDAGDTDDGKLEKEPAGLFGNTESRC